MDVRVARQVIAAVRRQKRRRIARLRQEEPDFAWDLWQGRDEPFLNELCLMMLVALHHEVERRLVKLGARFTGDSTRTLAKATYQRRVRAETAWQHAHGKRRLIKKLRLDSFAEWNGAMRTLQLLANCMKHSPSRVPDGRLLRHLKSPLVPGRRPTVTYATLPESAIFRERLASSLQLSKDADYCDIAEELLSRSDAFLAAVESQPGFSPVNFGKVSFMKFVG
jgi:hypothetical protein